MVMLRPSHACVVFSSCMFRKQKNTMQGLIQKIMVGGVKQAELSYRGGGGEAPRKFLKIRDFGFEFGGIFFKINTIYK